MDEDLLHYNSHCQRRTCHSIMPIPTVFEKSCLSFFTACPKVMHSSNLHGFHPCVNTDLGLVHCNFRSPCNQHRRVHSTATEYKNHSPHPYSWAKAKTPKTMTCLRKTASDVKDKVAFQISRTTANLLGKKPTRSLWFGKALHVTIDIF